MSPLWRLRGGTGCLPCSARVSLSGASARRSASGLEPSPTVLAPCAKQPARQDADLFGLHVGRPGEGGTDLGRLSGQSQRAQRAGVEVALCHEEHALAGGVLPFGQLGALDADRAGHLRVGELEELEGLVTVLADEDNDGAFLEALGVAVQERGPAGDEVVI